MTTDLSNKTVEELIAWISEAVGGVDGIIRLGEGYDELARRLEEAQQQIALAKAEALEETIEMAEKECEDLPHWNFKQEILYKAVQLLRQKAAEYRAKATEAGRKE